MELTATILGGSGWAYGHLTDGLRDLLGVGDTGQSKRAPEGATPLSQREACRVGMQMSSPTRLSACRVGHEAEPLRDGALNTAIDRDNPQQLGGRRALPATHTGAYRRRTTYH